MAFGLAAATTGAHAATVATPTFSPVAGTYNNAQSVTITTTTTGASIAYTTDGSTPTVSGVSITHGTLYSTPVGISATATVLKALAFKSGSTNSAVASGTYTLTATAPAFSPAAGTFNNAQSVTITTTTSGASIRYTTDGTTTPSSTVGTLYSGPVSISSTATTLKAIAFKTGFNNSTVTSGAYALTAAAPAFSPVAGTYTAVQTVAITSTTSGASIRYTTDGTTTPSSTVGTVYSGPISIGATMTLKAIAYETGFTSSTVTSGTYTINLPTAVAPTFSPVAGTYTSVQSVTITTTTSGATIHYTTDGSTPSPTAGTTYTVPVSVGATMTLKAIAFKAGFNNSTVASAAYTINLPTAAAPTFSPVAGTYTAVQSVTITSTTSGATIHYTTDGSTPSPTIGTTYTVPVSVGATMTLKAIAFKTGFNNSPVASAAYTINLPTAAAPSFSPAPGTFASTQSVTITSTTSGASIRYTTDNSAPTETNGTLYSSGSPVSISATMTLKAIAYKSGFLDSGVTSGTYTITPPAAAPTFSPVAGTYTAAQSVTITSTTSGASIRYTTDNSAPTETHGTLYSSGSPVSINATMTLKAIAYKSGFADSPVTSGNYTITLSAAAPVFSPAAGTFTSAQSVTITSTTSGASIRYTTDNSAPTETNGTLYSGAVSISSTTTLKAIAYKSGFTDSGVTSGIYTINAPISLGGLCLWLNADTGVTADSSGFVTTWADQSGNTNDATPDDPSYEPTLVTSASDLPNGQRVVHFDGNHRYLRLPNVMQDPQNPGQQFAQGEIFAVVRSTGIPGSLWGWGGANNAGSWYPTSEGTVWDDFGSTTIFDTGTPAQDLTQYHVYNISSSSTEWTQRFNGKANYDQIGNTVGFMPSPTIGTGSGAAFLAGDIAEVIVYNRVLTSAERDSVYQYLAAKYAPPAIVIPGTPVLKVYAVSPTQADLSWSAANAASQHTVTTIERQTGAGGFVQIAQLNDVFSYTDTGLAAAQTCTYRVKLASYAGISPYSNTVGITSPATGLPTTGLRLWLRSTAGITASGAAVSTWADESGLGNDAVQANSDLQPTVEAGQVNGLPVVHFTQDQQTELDFLTNPMVGAGGGEAFAVLRKTSSGFAAGLWNFGGSSNGSRYPEGDGVSIFDDFATTSWASGGGPPLDLTSFHVYNVGGDTTTWFQNFNGQPFFQRTGNTVGFNSTPAIGNGTSCWFDGDFAEIIIYSRVLTPAERTTVNTYLVAKYAIVFNPPPVAPSQSVTMAENTAVVITLVATQGNGHPLTYAVASSPTHGTLSGIAPDLVYTPVANYYGPDSFTFTAQDGAINSNTATVSISVVQPPVAANQSVTTVENVPVGITLVATQISNDPLAYVVAGSPAHGALSGTVPNLTYTPVANYYGSDSFTFTANDSGVGSNLATVSITVMPTPQTAAPVFSSAAGHSVVITSATTGATIRYTTNGGTPSQTNGTVYSGSIGISAPITLQAIAYKSGFLDSTVTSAAIGITTITIATPANGSTIP